ncbi:MAG: lytic transglycosylase domain-containing protein [Gallionellaceae bacterium]
MFRAVLILTLLFIANISFAADVKACFASASEKYSIDQTLLIAIAKAESSLKSNVVGPPNQDGSSDYGMMQINSSHLPLLRKAGFTKQDLFNPCVNIHIGAYILSKFIKKHGNTWRAVGAYNAGSKADREAARASYVKRVKPIYEKIKAKERIDTASRSFKIASGEIN